MWPLWSWNDCKDQEAIRSSSPGSKWAFIGCQSTRIFNLEEQLILVTIILDHNVHEDIDILAHQCSWCTPQESWIILYSLFMMSMTTKKKMYVMTMTSTHNVHYDYKAKKENSFPWTKQYMNITDIPSTEEGLRAQQFRRSRC